MAKGISLEASERSVEPAVYSGGGKIIMACASVHRFLPDSVCLEELIGRINTICAWGSGFLGNDRLNEFGQWLCVRTSAGARSGSMFDLLEEIELGDFGQCLQQKPIYFVFWIMGRGYG